MGAPACIPRTGVALTLCGIRKSEEDIVVSSLTQMSLGGARHQEKKEVLVDVETELGGSRQIVIVVVIAGLARGERIERRDRCGTRVQMLEVEAVVEAIVGATEASGLVERIEGPSLDCSRELRRSGTAAGNDVDDATDGIGPIKPALGTPQDLHPLDILSEELAEIEARARAARVADIDPIDQHLGVVCVRA